ncbi:MAG: Xaa-Pro peptidase family protein [Nanoarchaeota archaeon]
MVFARLKSRLKGGGVDAALFLGEDSHFRYLVGRQMHGAVLIVPVKGNVVLLHSPLERPVVAGIVSRQVRWPQMDVRGILVEMGVNAVGVSLDRLPAKLYVALRRGSRVVDIDKIMWGMRMIKTPIEQRLMRKVCRLTDRLFSEIVAQRGFRRESDIVLFIRHRAIDWHCELSFESIVATHRHAAVPHYEGDGPLRGGFLLMDFGLRLNGYCSDMTRTVHLGRPSAEHRAVYERLRVIQQDAIDMVRPRVVPADIDRAVRGAMGADAKFFIHGLGHGLGVDAHEPPGIGGRSGEPLRKGMIITIEPGRYRGFGIRIEDDVLVDSPREVLTRSSKRLITLTW